MSEPHFDSQPDPPCFGPPHPHGDPATHVERLQFAFCVAQKRDEGEDAEPLLLRSDYVEAGDLAVFDGMGGSGSTQYIEHSVTRTGAYIASHTVRDIVWGFFRNPRESQGGDDLPNAERKADCLADLLLEGLREKITHLEPAVSGTRLGGKMMRRLPTTLACLSYRGTAEQFTYEAFWAGDSRCYLLTPDLGLQQITLDDLRSQGDALENLLEDSPMSNFVNADSGFKLHATVGRCTPPAIFLVATDGCFNFCLSPAHFEHSILAALKSSRNIDEWRDTLRKDLERLAGDDLSMALIAAGWGSFGRVREAFLNRLTELSKNFIDGLNELDAQVNETALQHKRLLTARNELRRDLWTRYRQTYELFRNNDDKQVAR